MVVTLTYYTARVVEFDEGAFYTLRVSDQVGPAIPLRSYSTLREEMQLFESFDASNGLRDFHPFVQDELSDSEPVDQSLSLPWSTGSESYRVAVLSFALAGGMKPTRRAYLPENSSDLLRFLTVGGYLLSPDLADDDDGSDCDNFEDAYIPCSTFDGDWKFATFARGVL